MKLENGVYIIAVANGVVMMERVSAQSILESVDLATDALIEAAKRAPGRFLAKLLTTPPPKPEGEEE